MNKKEIKISALVHVHTNNGHLWDCLNSLSIFDQLLIVYSASGVKEFLTKVKHSNLKIIKQKNFGYVEAVRQSNINKVQYDWVFLLDADEILENVTMAKLRALINDNADVVGYWLERKNIIANHLMIATGWSPDYQLRLFNRRFVKWSNQLHSQPAIVGKTKKIDPSANIYINHYNYQNWFDYLDRLNQYTEITVEQQSQTLAQQNLCSAFFHEFFKRMFVEQAFRDLDWGIYLSLGQAFYQLTAVAKSKLKESRSLKEKEWMNQFNNELVKINREWGYWYSSWRISQSTGINKIYWKIIRKLHSWNLFC